MSEGLAHEHEEDDEPGVQQEEPVEEEQRDHPMVEDEHVARPVPSAPSVSFRKPPLDPRVLRHVLLSYDGDTCESRVCDGERVFHGHGRAVFRTGFTYEGAFHLGRMHGHGRLEWESGVCYEGSFMDNAISGSGTFTWPNGSSYVGDVAQGQRHGQGVFRTGSRGIMTAPIREPSGSSPTPRCMGDDGGHGGGGGGLPFAFPEEEEEEAGDERELDLDPQLLQATSNARYEGSWVHGYPEGQGVLVYDDDAGVRYEGTFVRGQRHGYGEMRYASGNLYTGAWRENVKSGHGTMLWLADKGGAVMEKYVGQWRDDRAHGRGRHVWLQAASREKNWYDGTFRQGQRHGVGTFYYANGARYEGQWRGNVKHGRGEFCYEDGRVWRGRFHEDRAEAVGAPVPTGVLLFVEDLLLSSSSGECSRKSVESAVLRVNTELRAWYRQYIGTQVLGSTAGGPGEGGREEGERGILLAFHECRRLLLDAGIWLSAGQLEALITEIRYAQRREALVKEDEDTDGEADEDEDDAGAEEEEEEEVEEEEEMLLLRVLPEVMAPSRLLVFREFAELLVRLASDTWAWTWSPLRVDSRSLSDRFTALVEQCSNARAVHNSNNSNNSGTTSGSMDDGGRSLLSLLLSDELRLVFCKHVTTLRALFAACCSHQDDSDNDPANADGTEDVHARQHQQVATVRTLLSVLRERGDVYSSEFRVRHALAALSSVLLSGQRVSGESVALVHALDPFLMDLPLVFSEFQDAVATILYAREQQHQHSEKNTTMGKTSNAPAPLFAIADTFLRQVSARSS